MIIGGELAVKLVPLSFIVKSCEFIWIGKENFILLHT